MAAIKDDSVLYLTVVSGSNLYAADVGGSSDPYVVIKDVTGLHMHGSKIKTATKKKTLNPVWNESFEFKCNYKLRKLSFQVYDHDTFSKDDIIGKTKVIVDMLQDQQEHTMAFPLRRNGAPAGELLLKLRMVFHYPIVLPGASLVIKERSLHLGLGWDTSKKTNIDLDASVIALDAEKKLVDHAAFDNRSPFGGAIAHQGDNRTGEGKGDDEVVFIDLAKLPPNVEWLIFTVNSFSRVPFTSVKSSYVRLLGKDTQATLAFSRMSKMDNSFGLFFGLLRKDPASGWWTFYSVQKLIGGHTWSSSLEFVQKLI